MYISRFYTFPKISSFLKYSNSLLLLLFFLSYIQVLFISEEMNKHGFVPKMPSQADLELIFDTSYQDVQPYLFKISHATSMPTSPSMGTAVRRLIRDTLTLS